MYKFTYVGLTSDLVKNNFDGICLPSTNIRFRIKSQVYVLYIEVIIRLRQMLCLFEFAIFEVPEIMESEKSPPEQNLQEFTLKEDNELRFEVCD